MCPSARGCATLDRRPPWVWCAVQLPFWVTRGAGLGRHWVTRDVGLHQWATRGIGLAIARLTGAAPSITPPPPTQHRVRRAVRCRTPSSLSPASSVTVSSGSRGTEPSAENTGAVGTDSGAIGHGRVVIDRRSPQVRPPSDSGFGPVPALPPVRPLSAASTAAPAASVRCGAMN